MAPRSKPPPSILYYDSYGGRILVPQWELNQEKPWSVPQGLMTEEAQETNTTTTTSIDDQPSKGWLQLGTTRRPIELNLFPDGPTVASASSSSPVASLGEPRKVISPPKRPIGLWIEMKADQVKEPFLPQIPKSYLRIKDGSMTVGLLMKYLANKLGLDSESQVEITCQGQHLHPTETLQHIRDNIWHATLSTVTTQDMQIGDHVMTLIYSRRA